MAGEPSGSFNFVAGLFMLFRRVDLKMKKLDSTKSLLIKSEQLLRIEDHDFAMRPGFGDMPRRSVVGGCNNTNRQGFKLHHWQEICHQTPIECARVSSHFTGDAKTDMAQRCMDNLQMHLQRLSQRNHKGSAIPVGIDVQVESIDSISEVNMDFTMTLYLRHYWQDDRLAFPSSNNKSRTFDSRLVKKIWVPDVFFVHSKRSFIHDTTMENIMLRVFPDGNILYSVRITVTALCSMDFSSFPLDTQNCSLELESYAYNENDLMLYWKNGNDSLRTDEIVLSQFFVEDFQPSFGLAFYSSTGWYNRLYINFILRRHIFFFMLQTYFPTMLMVMLSWVSFWIDRRAVPARVSLGITTVLTMSTIITGVSASMPQVSYVKAVDIYLWASFLFVFLSVIEYAAVNYFTTVEEMKKLKRAKIPASFDATQAMAFDGCFHDNDIDLTSFPEVSSTANTDRNTQSRNSTVSGPTEGTRLRRKNPLKHNLSFIMSNSYMIDSYSRVLFPLAYLLFNIIYWSLYA
ncbi:gamma-aminobutyric acid receptor subunit rho-3a isoform X2 [Nerophis ophidion]|uniref:gamma-aminobutyric acid receptor subunit rho-3a isoform X2 n=1 Tax=Nerophis ophidion TaxID=159077 RepID=UPI002ADF6E26|nr:gamma-aminobutyric acid receptor subunit rho-3a isoform X2 [Nerophis ophidion]